VIEVNGRQLNATVRGASMAQDATAIIRVEKVRISQTPSANAIELPLTTCMYLGNRWECLFGHAGEGIRAYAPQRLEAGNYWLQLDADKLWLY
jgi:iron(III) transport system ATP-binding protein